MILTPFFEEIEMTEEYENIPDFEYVLEEEKANPDQNKRLANNHQPLII